MDESQDIDTHLDGVSEMISKFEEKQVMRQRVEAQDKLIGFCSDMQLLDVDPTRISHMVIFELLHGYLTQDELENRSVFNKALIELNSIPSRYGVTISD